MFIRSTWRLGALVLAAVALASIQWGPQLFRSFRSQTALWVSHAEGEWRDIPLGSGRSQRAVSVIGEDPADLLLVADIPTMDGASYNALAEEMAVAVRDSVLREGTSTVDVMLMIDEGRRWPWERPQYRSYQYHFGGEPRSWKLVLYGGPAAERPEELQARMDAARARG